MTPGAFVTWILVGLVTGRLAGIVKKNRGQGMISDLLLGLSGSGAVSWIVWALNLLPNAGMVATAGIALLGAALVLVLERAAGPPVAPAAPRHTPPLDQPQNSPSRTARAHGAGSVNPSQ